jgi:hypothetical protein
VTRLEPQVSAPPVMTARAAAAAGFDARAVALACMCQGPACCC